MKEINEGVRFARIGEAPSARVFFFCNNKIKYQFVELEGDLSLVGRLISYCRR
jgi:hypothetical protein